ncbi:MAG TPA: LysR family transcriptional regulator, partial [Cyanophyceae cyanobacterium]
EEALRTWEIEPTDLDVILILNTGEMVKAVVENGVGAAAISELMVKKELQLGTLRSIRVIDDRNGSPRAVEIVRPFLKLKHRQRFQTRISKAFEKMLLSNESFAVAS